MYRKILVSWSIEFGPIILFFLASLCYPFVPAATIFVIATAVALVAGVVKDRRIAIFPLLAGASVILFGSATVILKDPFYLIIKDTVYNGLFAFFLLGGLCFNKLFLKSLFSSLFAMTDKGWRILSVRWTTMFILLTVSNELVRISFDETVWIHYKIVATLVTTVFGLYQITLSRRERLAESSKWGLRI